MDNQFDFDDGDWYWIYECQYVDDTNDTSDYSYNIEFETPLGGHLTNKEIDCRYWKTENMLQIIKEGSFINFYVENFVDIKKILIPMIKSENATIYTRYKSRNPIKMKRKEKLKQIMKLKGVKCDECKYQFTKRI